MDPTIPPACGSCAEEATMKTTRQSWICGRTGFGLLLTGFGLLLAAPFGLAEGEPASSPAPAPVPADTKSDAAKSADSDKSAAAEAAENVVEGEVVPGVQYYLSTDNRNSAKFEEYREVPNGFVLPRLLFS